MYFWGSGNKNVVSRVQGLTNDSRARQIAGKYGLSITNVTYEDNGRFKNSCWGPCISDMTLQVDGSRLPVIRSPNFEDLTWDVPMEKIPLVVGNEKGQPLRTIALSEYLQNYEYYLSNTNSYRSGSLYNASRDSHVIMSAQACMLPISKNNETKFNVCLFNYQSTASDPAVLVIVANAKGTSAQVVDGNYQGQKLFFNKNGSRCSFVGQRLSDNRRERGVRDRGQPMTQQEKQENVILVIQVPLKKKRPVASYPPPPGSFYSMECNDMSFGGGMNCVPQSAPMKKKCRKRGSNVENAIVKVGRSEGHFSELNGLSIERDTRFPVRVTLQYYKGTDNGVVNDSVMSEISQQLRQARKYADNIGSLVVGGYTNRPTEHHVPNPAPYSVCPAPIWWEDFWCMYGSTYPQWTKEAARQRLFHGGRYINSSMTQVRDQMLDLLGKDEMQKDAATWNVVW